MKVEIEFFDVKVRPLPKSGVYLAAQSWEPVTKEYKYIVMLVSDNGIPVYVATEKAVSHPETITHWAYLPKFEDPS